MYGKGGGGAICGFAPPSCGYFQHLPYYLYFDLWSIPASVKAPVFNFYTSIVNL